MKMVLMESNLWLSANCSSIFYLINLLIYSRNHDQGYLPKHHPNACEQLPPSPSRPLQFALRFTNQQLVPALPIKFLTSPLIKLPHFVHLPISGSNFARRIRQLDCPPFRTSHHRTQLLLLFHHQLLIIFLLCLRQSSSPCSHWCGTWRCYGCFSLS